MALKAGRKGVNGKQVDAYGNLIDGGGGGGYTLPIASPSTLGGVQPVAKTSGMTQDVGVDSAGKLYTAPGEGYTLPTATPTTLGGVQPVEKTSGMTQDVGVDSAGKLYTAPGGGGGSATIYYKDFAFDNDMHVLDVSVAGYTPISVSMFDVYTGNGGRAALCINYTGTDKVTVFGVKNQGATTAFKARVYYVANANVEQLT